MSISLLPTSLFHTQIRVGKYDQTHRLVETRNGADNKPGTKYEVLAAGGKSSSVVVSNIQMNGFKYAMAKICHGYGFEEFKIGDRNMLKLTKNRLPKLLDFFPCDVTDVDQINGMRVHVVEGRLYLQFGYSYIHENLMKNKEKIKSEFLRALVSDPNPTNFKVIDQIELSPTDNDAKDVLIVEWLHHITSSLLQYLSYYTGYLTHVPPKLAKFIMSARINPITDVVNLIGICHLGFGRYIQKSILGMIMLGPGASVLTFKHYAESSFVTEELELLNNDITDPIRYVRYNPYVITSITECPTVGDQLCFEYVNFIRHATNAMVSYPIYGYVKSKPKIIPTTQTYKPNNNNNNNFKYKNSHPTSSAIRFKKLNQKPTPME
jgi:hypothetical protein